MPQRCLICGGYGSKGYFQVPLNNSAWSEVCPLRDCEKKISKNSKKVCFKHFDVKDLIIHGDIIKPRKGTKFYSIYPSLFDIKIMKFLSNYCTIENINF